MRLLVHSLLLGTALGKLPESCQKATGHVLLQNQHTASLLAGAVSDFQETLAELPLQLGEGNASNATFALVINDVAEHHLLEGLQTLMYLIGVYYPQIQSVLLTVAFLTCCFFPALYKSIRMLVRPAILQQIEAERPWIMWLQEFRHPFLDTLHMIASHSCGIYFYIMLLPFLFWIGELQVARLLTLLMAMCTYVAGALKDLICAPRPDWKRGVVLVGHSEGDETSNAHEEYGFPSSHTINTICMLVFCGYFYSFSLKMFGLSLFASLDSSTDFKLCVVAGICWTAFIIHGRIYLGMHSPVDVVGGVAVAAVLMLVFLPVELYLDAWITSSSYSVPAYATVFAILLCWTYPVSLRPTPSFDYAVYFTGVGLGVIIGVWRCPQFHNEQAQDFLEKTRGPVLSIGFWLFALRRFFLGLILVLALRALSKEILKLVVPFVMDLLAIPHSDHDKFYALKQDHCSTATPETDVPPCKPVGYNVLTPIRLLNYAVVGWASTEAAFELFERLRI